MPDTRTPPLTATAFLASTVINAQTPEAEATDTVVP